MCCKGSWRRTTRTTSITTTTTFTTALTCALALIATAAHATLVAVICCQRIVDVIGIVVVAVSVFTGWVFDSTRCVDATNLNVMPAKKKERKKCKKRSEMHDPTCSKQRVLERSR
jgi:hypothetical protein